MLLLLACVETNVERIPKPPEVDIVSPEIGAQVRQGEGAIRFEGLVSDEFDPPESLALEWMVDESGAVSGAPSDTEGKCTFDLDVDALDVGEHTMTLRATDTDGKLDYAVLPFEIRGPASAPEVQITSPEDGFSAIEGDSITFQGLASDLSTPADDLEFTWSSDLAGDLSGAISGDGQTVLITDKLALGKHLITLVAEDLDGEIGSDTITVIVGQDPPAEAKPGDLVFSEMMVNPQVVDDTVGEWVELYNTSGYAIDVTGYTFRDDDADSWVLEGPLVVNAGDYLVLCAEMDLSINGGVPCDGWFFRDSTGLGLALANGEDELVLARPDGVEIDWLHYDGDWFTPAFATGVDPDFQEEGANDDGANWCDQTTVITGGGEPGTPGRVNDQCD